MSLGGCQLRITCQSRPSLSFLSDVAMWLSRHHMLIKNITCQPRTSHFNEIPVLPQQLVGHLRVQIHAEVELLQVRQRLRESVCLCVRA